MYRHEKRIQMIIVEIESILNSLVQVKQGMQVRKLDFAAIRPAKRLL